MTDRALPIRGASIDLAEICVVPLGDIALPRAKASKAIQATAYPFGALPLSKPMLHGPAYHLRKGDVLPVGLFLEGGILTLRELDLRPDHTL
jgi:hypothetical protein